MLVRRGGYGSMPGGDWRGSRVRRCERVQSLVNGDARRLLVGGFERFHRRPKCIGRRRRSTRGGKAGQRPTILQTTQSADERDVRGGIRSAASIFGLEGYNIGLQHIVGDELRQVALH